MSAPKPVDSEKKHCVTAAYHTCRPEQVNYTADAYLSSEDLFFVQPAVDFRQGQTQRMGTRAVHGSLKGSEGSEQLKHTTHKLTPW